jgi:hypothetical protein
MDVTISGLREQLSQLREKIQDLKDLFSHFDTNGNSGGVAGNGLAGKVGVTGAFLIPKKKMVRGFTLIIALSNP